MFNPTQVHERIDALRQAIKEERDPLVMSHHLAELHATLSERAEISSDKMERHTKKLVTLTWLLAFLTFALFVLTVFLSYDAYQKSKGDHLGAGRDTKQGKTNE